MEIENHVYLDTVLVSEDHSLADHSNLWVMNIFMFDFVNTQMRMPRAVCDG